MSINNILNVTDVIVYGDDGWLIRGTSSTIYFDLYIKKSKICYNNIDVDEILKSNEGSFCFIVDDCKYNIQVLLHNGNESIQEYITEILDDGNKIDWIDYHKCGIPSTIWFICVGMISTNL